MHGAVREFFVLVCHCVGLLWGAQCTAYLSNKEDLVHHSLDKLRQYCAKRSEIVTHASIVTQAPACGLRLLLANLVVRFKGTVACCIHVQSCLCVSRCCLLARGGVCSEGTFKFQMHVCKLVVACPIQDVHAIVWHTVGSNPRCWKAMSSICCWSWQAILKQTRVRRDAQMQQTKAAQQGPRSSMCRPAQLQMTSWTRI